MTLSNSHYRRPLPEPCIAFSSSEGKTLFRQALESGTVESFFPLIEQFHTQADPAFCGLGSLVMSLNALGVDPGRVWRGPWRWFSEELLDCCTPLDAVRQAGLSLEEVACLARCNGAEVSLSRPSTVDLPIFRETIERTVRTNDAVLIVSYLRSGLGQTGAGHYSPIGGYHAARDLALVLDVARFKYPPHWVPVQALFEATRALDPVTSKPRGWLELERRDIASAISNFVTCREGIAIKDRLETLLSLHQAAFEAAPPATLEAVLATSARALGESGLLEAVQVRAPSNPEQVALVERLRAELRQSPLHRRAELTLEGQRATPVVIWMFAAPPSLLGRLPEPLRAELAAHLDPSSISLELSRELLLLRSQVQFLLEHARGASAAPAESTQLPREVLSSVG